MKKKQYIISSEILQEIPLEFTQFKFGDFNLYFEAELEVNNAVGPETQICLLGFIINPFQPKETNQEIVHSFLKLDSKEKLFEELENYSGRYVILYKNSKDLVVFHDMFGQRQLNYLENSGTILLSSSVKLLLEVIQQKTNLIPENEKLNNDKGFQLFDQWFLGDLTWDRNVKKLLPNHYFDLNQNKAMRLPFFNISVGKESEVLHYVSQTVKGNYEAIHHRYDQVFQALTAGYDSRTLLALSKPFWKQIQFYTFSRGDANSQRDSKIAKDLSAEFGFSYQSIQKLAKNHEFEQSYVQNFIVPRTTPKFYNILYFSQFKSGESINLTGDGVQMVRNLRSPEQLDSAEKLFDSLGYSHHSYHLENCKSWLDSARKFSEDNGVLISDLFTQEIAQGQLTARWAHEFDLSGCEEFNPFNHKKMIYLILKSIPYEQRISPDYDFQKKLMENSVQTITRIPFNPPTWKDQIKKILKRN